MRSSMAAFPQIVFIDGTYKFLKRKLTLMLIVVEDANAETQIVGVGLLASETRPVLKWFIECFKDSNAEACKNINCFMTDKDLTERSVIEEILPGIPMYICLFHSLRTFGREISREKRNISSEERLTALSLMSQLAKSSSADAYDKIYSEFCQTVPAAVKEYFDLNWHLIRDEWTVYSMCHGNLGNTTNNRLESLNGKLGISLRKNSTLVRFITDFFSFLSNRALESNHRRAQEALRKDFSTIPHSSDELNYKQFLSNYAFSLVMKEISLHDNITLQIKKKEPLEYFVNVHGKKITVTQSGCECLSWTSNLLPCKHIFAVRKKIQLPLFDQSLCHSRWKKDVKLSSISTSLPKIPEENMSNEAAGVSVTKIVLPKRLTEKQKRSELTPVLNNILYSASRSSQPAFEYTLKKLRELQSDLRRGVSQDNSITDTDETINITDDMGNLSIESKITGTKKKQAVVKTLADDLVDLDDLNLPTPLKVIGRASILHSAPPIKRIPKKLKVKRP